MDYTATSIRHRPDYCPYCGSPKVHRSSYDKYDTGAVSFHYLCRTCNSQCTVKVFDIPPAEQAHIPGAILKILSAERIDQLIRSIYDIPDFVQDAWLAVLASSAQSEEDVLEIARKVSSKRRAKYIRDEHTLRSMDKPLGGDDDNYTLESVLSSPIDEISEVEDRLDAKHPVKPSLKVRIAFMEDGDEIDLSTVSRVEVAAAVHCVPEHISQIFMGKAEPSLPLAYDIAKYLNTTIDYLYKAISGANGSNPNRMEHNRFRPKATWKSFDPLPPKYSVDGKGYPNLREALLSLGVEYRRPTHYNALSDDLKARIVRNRPHRGR